MHNQLSLSTLIILYLTLIWDAFIAGMPITPARIHMRTAIPIVILVARFPLCEWNFRSGSTIAKNRSPERAVSVKTETPIDKSLKNSEALHINSPHGHDGWMKIADVNGTWWLKNNTEVNNHLGLEEDNNSPSSQSQANRRLPKREYICKA